MCLTRIEEEYDEPLQDIVSYKVMLKGRGRGVYSFTYYGADGKWFSCLATAVKYGAKFTAVHNYVHSTYGERYLSGFHCYKDLDRIVPGPCDVVVEVTMNDVRILGDEYTEPVYVCDKITFGNIVKRGRDT